MQTHVDPTRSGTGAQAPKAPSVLLVEDDPGVRELVCTVLKLGGFSVLKARHSAEALHMNHEYQGDLCLLLTDFRMDPHLNGRQLAGLIRLSRPGIPVLYISGCVDDPGLSGEIENGQARFLPKPFTTEALLETVRLTIGESVEAGQPT